MNFLLVALVPKHLNSGTFLGDLLAASKYIVYFDEGT
jgi:hypothetical protein